MILATLAAAVSVAGCNPVPGADQLWKSRATRYVMVGETHGTNEAPQLFADLVCQASKTRPVIVALEQPPSEQGAIDAFLKSNGNADARATFLKSSIWSGSCRDGRSSEAMLALFEQLRELKKAARVRGVVAFQAYDLAVPFSNANEGINRGMAAALKRVAAANPEALVLGYAGSAHVSLNDASNFGVHSASARLPREQVRTVLIEGENGSAWNCQDDRCAPHAYSPQNTVCRPGVRQLILPNAGQLPGFDAVACVGKPFTASPPAVPLAGM